MQYFFGVSLDELRDYLDRRGLSKVHASTLFKAVYKDQDLTPWLRPLLPKSLVSSFTEDFSLQVAKIAQVFISKYDHSVKFTVSLADERRVEMVLMPETKRLTLCISTQVGCRQGCVFCRTGEMGLIRNLEASEIVAQLVLADLWLKENSEWLTRNRHHAKTRITNLVMMGMGEPLDNVDAVIKAITVFKEPFGPHLAMRRISVSTAGHLDGLKHLLLAHPKAAIALSLHEADLAKRSKLMPINRRWPVTEVLDFLRDHLIKENPRASILIQYLVISGVNDSLDHARSLSSLLQNYPVKINLIPLNEVKERKFTAPHPASLHAMRDHLHQEGLRVMVRYSKGQDIGAACGQLAADGDLGYSE